VLFRVPFHASLDSTFLAPLHEGLCSCPIIAHAEWLFPSNIRDAVTSFLSPTPAVLDISFIVPLLPVTLNESPRSAAFFSTSGSSTEWQWPHETTLFPHGPTHHIASKHSDSVIPYTKSQSVLPRSSKQEALLRVEFGYQPRYIALESILILPIVGLRIFSIC
jgi:hypothetical protein